MSLQFILYDSVVLKAWQENPQNQPFWVHKSSQRLNQQPGTDLGPLLICSSCVTWSSCETLGSGRSDCLWLCCLFGGPVPPTNLPYPALIEEEAPSLTVTWYIMAAWNSWDASLCRKRNRGGEVDGMGGRGLGRKEGGKGDFGWDVKAKQNKINKRKEFTWHGAAAVVCTACPAVGRRVWGQISRVVMPS